MTLNEFKALPMLLTLAQACQAIGCHKDTVRVLRLSHEDLAVKIGKQWRYRKITVAQIAGIKYE